MTTNANQLSDEQIAAALFAGGVTLSDAALHLEGARATDLGAGVRWRAPRAERG